MRHTFIGLTYFALMAFLACGNNDGAGSAPQCPTGSEGCACTPGAGCDPGLECRSNLCVEAGTGNTSSAAGSDTNNSVSTSSASTSTASAATVAGSTASDASLSTSSAKEL